MDGVFVVAPFEQAGDSFPNTCKRMQRVQFRLISLFREALNPVDETIVGFIHSYTVGLGQLFVHPGVKHDDENAFFKFFDILRHKTPSYLLVNKLCLCGKKPLIYKITQEKAENRTRVSCS